MYDGKIFGFIIFVVLFDIIFGAFSLDYASSGIGDINIMNQKGENVQGTDYFNTTNTHANTNKWDFISNKLISNITTDDGNLSFVFTLILFFNAVALILLIWQVLEWIRGSG